MVVRCINNHFDSGYINPHLTIGKEYKIVSIVLYFGKEEVVYQLVNDDKLLALYTSEKFELIDSKVEPDWVMLIHNYNVFEFTPEPFSYPGFLEEYHDDDEKAVNLFKTRFPGLID